MQTYTNGTELLTWSIAEQNLPEKWNSKSVETNNPELLSQLHVLLDGSPLAIEGLGDLYAGIDILRSAHLPNAVHGELRNSAIGSENSELRADARSDGGAFPHILLFDGGLQIEVVLLAEIAHHGSGGSGGRHILRGGEGHHDALVENAAMVALGLVAVLRIEGVRDILAISKTEREKRT